MFTHLSSTVNHISIFFEIQKPIKIKNYERKDVAYLSELTKI